MRGGQGVAFVADLDRLEELVDRARRCQVRVEETLTHLDLVVADLHVRWSGQAAAAHRRAHLEWRHGAASMRRGVGGLAEAVSHARGAYAAAAVANSSSWSGLR